MHSKIWVMLLEIHLRVTIIEVTGLLLQEVNHTVLEAQKVLQEVQVRAVEAVEDKILKKLL